MRTWYAVILNDYVKGTAWDINKTGHRKDYVVFSSTYELANFIQKKVGFDGIDNTQRLREGDEVIATYCILAEDYLDAINRAWDIMQRYDR